MLLDNQSLFSDAQSITTGTIYSTNVVKFGSGDVSFVPIIVQVVEDFNELTSLNVAIQTSDDAEFTTSTTLAESKLLLADLKTGAKFPLTHLPKGNKGYMRLAYTVTGTAATQGKITAGVVASDEYSFHNM